MSKPRRQDARHQAESIKLLREYADKIRKDASSCMSDNKPPMTIYFRENISTVHMDGSHMDNRFGQAFANRKRESDVGPYVHIGQFMEEVERRAEKRALAIANHMGGEYYCPEYYFADKAKELAKEIMEGKA